MPLCYWKLCDCPDKTPTGQACAQHQGYSCSFVNGAPVRSETQINDAITAGLEAEIAAVDRDKVRVDAKMVDLRAKRARLEQIHRDLEAAYNQSSSANERRLVIRQARVALQTFSSARDEIRADLDELDRIVNQPRRAIQAGRLRLRMPYRSAPGLCACNDRKIAALDALAAQIQYWDVEQARLYGAFQAQHSGIMLQWIAAIPPTIGIFSALIAIILFGAGYASLIIPVLGFLLLVFLLVGSQMRLNNTGSQLLNADRTLATLVLAYYRVQQIPACQHTLDTANVDWSKWWQEWFEGLGNGWGWFLDVEPR